jgi:hypothetical protein
LISGNSTTILGVEFTQKSDQKCTDDIYYGFTSVIECNELITAQPKVKDVVMDTCHPKVTIQHAAGCPTLTLYYLVNDMRQTWVAMLVLIIFGLLNLIKGYEIFPYSLGIAVGCLTMFYTMQFMTIFMLPASIEFRWTFGAIFCVIAALLAKSYIQLVIAFIGSWIGFYTGLLIYSVFEVFDFKFALLKLFLTGVFAITFAKKAFKHDNKLTLIIPTLLGSYCLTRGCSIMFGGFPTDSWFIHQIEGRTNTGFQS